VGEGLAAREALAPGEGLQPLLGYPRQANAPAAVPGAIRSLLSLNGACYGR
jgi:hypothetical protein